MRLSQVRRKHKLQNGNCCGGTNGQESELFRVTVELALSFLFC